MAHLIELNETGGRSGVKERAARPLLSSHDVGNHQHRVGCERLVGMTSVAEADPPTSDRSGDHPITCQPAQGPPAFVPNGLRDSLSRLLTITRPG